MNRDLEMADRQEQVRATARSWHRAGLIDDATRAAMERIAPDSRRRLGPILRAVAYAFTLVACIACLALVLILADPGDETVVALLIAVPGCALLALTEALKRLGRFAQAGLESATAHIGATLTVVGLAWLAADHTRLRFDDSIALAWGLGAVVFGAVCIRWGSTVAALASTTFLYLLLAQSSQPRLAWTGATIVLLPIALRLHRRPGLAPSHRRAALGAALVALIGLYAAWHVGSWDVRLLEHGLHVAGASHPQRPPLPRVPLIAATALIPVVTTAFAIATRGRALWVCGLLLAATSLVTLRSYVHLAPLWVVLVGAGALLLASALLVRRWLESGPEGERRGFTARALSDEGRRLGFAEIVVSAGVASATSPRPPDTSQEGFRPGEGRSGGGGASGQY